jgi:hypothetical protein
MKKLLVAALMVVLASPAFAAIQNVKVSGDITSTFVDRNTFNLGLTGTLEGSTASNDFAPVGLKKQNVFLTQTRLRVDADLSDNVSTTVSLINERAWNAENGSPTSLDTNVQLYLASVTMRELLYSPLTVTVGRQIFTYGNGLIIGNGVPNQTVGNLQYIDQDLSIRTAEDGIRAVLDYKPLTIDLFYYKNGQNYLNGNPNSGKSSSDVYGINANYQLNDPMNTVVEGYLFTRLNGNSNALEGVDVYGNAIPADKGDTLYVPGLRASTNPIKGLNVQGEFAWQLGNHPVTTLTGTTGTYAQHEEAERREAMAAQFIASYALPVLDKYKPTVNASFTYVSGDKNANQNYSSSAVKSSKVDTAWDPFANSDGSGTIYGTLYQLTNLYILSAGASVSPLEDVTATFTWSDLYAATRYSAQNPLYIYQPDSGAALFTPQTSRDTGLGNEYDVNFTYNYTEDVTFGVALGWYVPGNAFTKNDNNTASQAIANVAVKF